MYTNYYYFALYIFNLYNRVVFFMDIVVIYMSVIDLVVGLQAIYKILI